MLERIAEIIITPIAFRDPPLLNAFGVHEAWALRSIIEIRTDKGTLGLSESYGDESTLTRLEACKDQLIGLDIFDVNGLWQRIKDIVQPTNSEGMELAPGTTNATTIPRVAAAFEVALFDIMGKMLGRPVYDLLGGAVQKRIPYSAYLFYKWDRHSFLDDGWVDEWGEALTPQGIVEQAQRMCGMYGFSTIKLKGGVMEPEAEVEAVRALRAAFPDAPLRLDPNGAWTVETTQKYLPELEGLLEYLEDPVPGIPDMGRVQSMTSLPLATNMCVVNVGQIPDAVREGAIKVVLSDHHYWGGFTATSELAAICRVFGWGLSMHSNSHLGISLMAMSHAAAACPNLTYSCDTHYPWQKEEIVQGGKIAFDRGCVTLGDQPGLGVELDHDALAALHQNWLECGIRSRDDTAEMRRYDPNWAGKIPRF